MAEHLQGLTTPSVTESDLPWMRDFWENEMHCNLPGSFTNAYSTMCGAGASLGQGVAQELAGDQKVVQTVNAVTSILTALSARCSDNRWAARL